MDIAFRFTRIILISIFEIIHIFWRWILNTLFVTLVFGFIVYLLNDNINDLSLINIQEFFRNVSLIAAVSVALFYLFYQLLGGNKAKKVEYKYNQPKIYPPNTSK